MAKKNSFSSGMLTGVLLIIVGLVWVLINYDILDITVWNLWPLAVVFLGILIIIKERNFNNPVPLIMIVMGIAFLIANLEIIDFWDWYDAVSLWPVALIIIGGSIVFKRVRKPDNDTSDPVD